MNFRGVKVGLKKEKIKGLKSVKVIIINQEVANRFEVMTCIN